MCVRTRCSLTSTRSCRSTSPPTIPRRGGARVTRWRRNSISGECRSDATPVRDARPWGAAMTLTQATNALTDPEAPAPVAGPAEQPSLHDLTDDLALLRDEVLLGPGEDATERQHNRGRLTARSANLRCFAGTGRRDSGWTSSDRPPTV